MHVADLIFRGTEVKTNLFLGDLSHSKVRGLWVGEVKSRDGGSRLHGQRLGQFNAWMQKNNKKKEIRLTTNSINAGRFQQSRIIMDIFFCACLQSTDLLCCETTEVH